MHIFLWLPNPWAFTNFLLQLGHVSSEDYEHWVVDEAGYVETGGLMCIPGWVFEVDETGNKLGYYVDVDCSVVILGWKAGVDVDWSVGVSVRLEFWSTKRFRYKKGHVYYHQKTRAS